MQDINARYNTDIISCFARYNTELYPMKIFFYFFSRSIPGHHMMVSLTNYRLFTPGKQTCLLLFREDGGVFADEEVRAIKKAEKCTLHTQSVFVVMPADYSSFSFFF